MPSKFTKIVQERNESDLTPFSGDSLSWFSNVLPTSDNLEISGVSYSELSKNLFIFLERNFL